MNVLIAGDFAPRFRVATLLAENKYEEVWAEVKAVIQHDVDYAIVNFESPVVLEDAEAISKTGPHLKCTAKAVESIGYAGFNCVTLANNHFRDYGEKGVRDTIAVCRDHAIDCVGGGVTLGEAEKVLYKTIKGKTLAIINVCEHEWSIATATNGGAAPLNPVANYYKILEAKSQADYVVVIVHGGTEQYNLPTPRMQQVYRFFIDAGADVVVNHHQHCYSGYEQYHGKYIFYGLGNLCFDREQPVVDDWNEGFFFFLMFDKDLKFELIPYMQCAANPAVELMNDSQPFFSNLQLLNSVIADDVLLKQSFDQLVAQKKAALLECLEPYGCNRYFKALRHRRLFPSLLSRRQLRLILAIFRCEAYRDIMFKAVQDRLGA